MTAKLDPKTWTWTCDRCGNCETTEGVDCPVHSVHVDVRRRFEDNDDGDPDVGKIGYFDLCSGCADTVLGRLRADFTDASGIGQSLRVFDDYEPEEVA